jgi:hypothetical protein
MVNLKQQLQEREKRGDCVIHENYSGPNQLGELLLLDLKASIETDFPLLDDSYPNNNNK